MVPVHHRKLTARRMRLKERFEASKALRRMSNGLARGERPYVPNSIKDRDDDSTYADPNVGLGNLFLAFLAGGFTALGNLS
jgi:hypothetical protein